MAYVLELWVMLEVLARKQTEINHFGGGQLKEQDLGVFISNNFMAVKGATRAMALVTL